MFSAGGNVVDIMWVGKDKDIVLMLTTGTDSEAGGHVYRSEKNMISGSFADVTYDMDGAITKDKQEVDPQFAGVMELVVHKTDPTRIMARGTGPFYWISKDSGMTWTRFQLPKGTVGYGTSLRMHPYDPDKILSFMPRPGCLNPINSRQLWCTHDLMLHTSFGDSEPDGWKNLTSISKGEIAGWVDFDWGANARKQRDEEDSDKARGDLSILATVFSKPGSGSGLNPVWSEDVHFVRIDDPTRNFGGGTLILECGNQVEVSSFCDDTDAIKIFNKTSAS